MTWVVRLAKIGADGEEHWVDVAQIARPGDLGDIANLGLTMTEGKLVLAPCNRSSLPDKPGSTPPFAGRVAESVAVFVA